MVDYIVILCNRVAWLLRTCQPDLISKLLKTQSGSCELADSIWFYLTRAANPIALSASEMSFMKARMS
jgi:hypothetical protein